MYLDNAIEYCDGCRLMVQTCHVISKLPASVMDKLVEEKKIRQRKCLLPIQEEEGKSPSAWQEVGQIKFRKRTQKAKPPNPTPKGYIIYAN
jgi:hypothetical protein